jgi:AcrR family transcriptional regulator
MARPADPSVRSKLLAAAEQVFGAMGVERAHVEAISSAAGVSKGAFYNHFSSKDDAFVELVNSVTVQLRELITRPELPAQSMSAQAFHDLCLAFDIRIFEFIWENRRLMRLILEGGRSHAFVHLLDEFADYSRLLTKAHLEYGRTHGFFRDDLDVDLAATFLAGGYDRLARSLVRMNERPDLPALLASAQRTALFGIARTTGAAPSGEPA